MIDYEQASKVIERNREIANFGDADTGVSGDWMDKTEEALGIKLPPSYRWWSENYGGGEICGEEIYSIYEQDFDTFVGGGDIVYMYRLDQRDGHFKPHEIAICHSDIDNSFYFDTAVQTPDNEYPVMSSATGKVYAKNFLEFLIERIKICGGQI